MANIGEKRCIVKWGVHVANVLLLISLINADTFSEQQQLYTDLLPNMDVLIRPVANQSDTVNVTLTAILKNILNVDEKSQLLSSTIIWQLAWTYETLQWQPSLYGGANVVHLLPSKTWLPDLTYMNSVGNNQEMHRGDEMRVTVTANGQVLYRTGGNIDTTCPIDITKYPFDTQQCDIVIGKAFSSDDELMIQLISSKANLHGYEQNGGWNLIDTKLRYHKPNSRSVTTVSLELTLQRRALFYTLNIIIPVILLSAMNVLSFKLPTSSGERMGYCISLFLTFVVLLDMVSDEMPKISITVSYLQLYVNVQLTLGVIITTLSMMLVRLANNDGDKCKHRWIINLYNISHRKQRKDQVAPIHDTENIGDHQSKQNTPKKTSAIQQRRYSRDLGLTDGEEELDKMTVVAFIDKMCFWIFLCLFVLSTFVYMVLMAV